MIFKRKKREEGDWWKGGQMKKVIILAASLLLSGCGATIYDPETLIKKMEKCLSIGMLPSITVGQDETGVRCVERVSL